MWHCVVRSVPSCGSLSEGPGGQPRALVVVPTGEGVL